MSISQITSEHVPVHIWSPLHEVEGLALTQLRNIASLPWVFHHVAAMPDVHLGKGATVGSVVAMKGAVSPAAVGVDIGCGMGAVKTNIRADQLPTSLKALRLDIEERIPVGFEEHDETILKKSQRQFFDEFPNLHKGVQRLASKALKQVGTLGGGNHFIEFCLDDGTCDRCGGSGMGSGDYADPNCGPNDGPPACTECEGTGKHEPFVWIMLHSGSRHIGNAIGELHIKTAKQLEHNKYLPDRDLSVFLQGSPEFQAYIHDLTWAQDYAFLNRRMMFTVLQDIVLTRFPFAKFEPPVLCHHNYVSLEQHYGEDLIVTRKGAISARKGELGIIPGSMGTKSFIVEGLGSEESFQSASHGAGRKMSRSAARKKFDVHDLVVQTQGIECRKDKGVIDEIPAAYKDIEQVMKNQADLVRVVATLHQVLCVKGGDR
jgi:tRNA-splicing ligase RtcB